MTVFSLSEGIANRLGITARHPERLDPNGRVYYELERIAEALLRLAGGDWGALKIDATTDCLARAVHLFDLDPNPDAAARDAIAGIAPGSEEAVRESIAERLPAYGDEPRTLEAMLPQLLRQAFPARD